MALITISQGIGCEGLAIARRVATKLNIELIDDWKLQETALNMGVLSSELKHLNEKAPGLFDRIFTNKPERYLDLMDAVVYEVARKGRGVILGHGSQILLRDFECALHVLIHEDTSRRVLCLMEKQGLKKESAFELIEKHDAERNGYFKYAFNMNINDPSLYDLVVNTHKIRLEAAADLIVSLAAEDDIRECGLSAMIAMEKMALEKKIHAALAENNLDFSKLSIKVQADGIVRLSGLVDTDKARTEVIRTVKAVEGVTVIQSDIVVMLVPLY